MIRFYSYLCELKDRNTGLTLKNRKFNEETSHFRFGWYITEYHCRPCTQYNHALNKLGYPTHEIEKYNFMVGNGIDKLFERALPEGEKSKENVLRVRKEFVPYYDVHNADDSRPYPGIPELLSYLQDAGIQIAVASNKYQAATQKLIGHYFRKSILPLCSGNVKG